MANGSNTENLNPRYLFMRQFLVMTVFFLVSPLLAQTANTPDAIIAHENTFWKAYGDGNVEDLFKAPPTRFRQCEAEIWSRDQVLTFLRQFHQRCTLAPVKLVDPDVTFLTPEIDSYVEQVQPLFDIERIGSDVPNSWFQHS